MQLAGDNRPFVLLGLGLPVLGYVAFQIGLPALRQARGRWEDVVGLLLFWALAADCVVASAARPPPHPGDNVVVSSVPTPDPCGPFPPLPPSAAAGHAGGEAGGGQEGAAQAQVSKQPGRGAV